MNCSKPTVIPFRESEAAYMVRAHWCVTEPGLAQIEDEARSKKLRGGYYTPSSITRIMAQWATQDHPQKLLEPSAGDGAFVQSLIPLLSPSATLTAVELSQRDAIATKYVGGDQTIVFCGDFFSWYEVNAPNQYFDAVVGNPPFIRYQDFPEQQRETAFALMREIGLNPNRLTNAWVPFVALGIRALREGGLFAMVLPAELLQVNYAGQLRQFLAKELSSLNIVTFHEIVFPGIQQETIIVLGAKGSGSAPEVSFIELPNDSSLSLDRIRGSSEQVNDLKHDKEKWLQYYLSRSELGLIREIEESGTFRPLMEFAEVDVGIVTGRNEFFVLTEDRVNQLGLEDFVIPVVGRSHQIPGLMICRAEWDQLVDEGQKVFLLQLGQLTRDELPPAALEYVSWGEDRGFHTGYKCRIRMPTWWNVPSVWIPDAFMLRQIHRAPRIIFNGSGSVCTDTIHRIRTKGCVSGEDLAGVSINSVTSAFAEIRGRSYGGGVLELEPREAEALPFPTPTPAVDMAEIDSLFRSGANMEAVDVVDLATIRSAGLSEAEVRTLRDISEKMSNRRIRRKRRKR